MQNQRSIPVLVAACLLMLTTHLQAQSGLEAQQLRFDGKTIDGFALKVDGSREAVQKAWKEFINERGSARRAHDYLYILELNWPGLSGTEMSAYAKVTALEGLQARLWFGIDSAQFGPGLDADMLVTQVLNDFELTYYRNGLADMLAEAERAMAYLSKEQHRAQKEQGQLQRALERNAEEKKKLEQALEENAEEKVELQQQVMENEERRMKAMQDLEIIGQRIEQLKKRLANFTVENFESE